MTDFCSTPTCASRDTPPWAAEGATVCARCVTRLREDCTAIPTLWRPWTATAALYPTRAASGRRAPGVAPAAPANLVALVMTDVRTSWDEPGDLLNPQRALAEVSARILRDGAGQARALGSLSVAESCAVIGVGPLHWWALAQEWAGAMCWTVRLVRHQLGGLAHEVRPRPVGTCEGCQGPLWVSGMSVVCRACRTDRSGFELLGLSA
ncbi:hypothetical protein GCM10022243_48480 [Saccharothrix violaceirubra]|uniref:Uncharacterized protein n=1 Tax=Saccharothrix violaceirubra TaxID=413306 RepID=A0A7W7T1V4_9PSEU|nr:hypothetical protein [Saccharothrix violaceirubra]MBB4963810.1 hypothetical protein [Saccharothrix violaceirubra]